jgi:fructosamine-3-kinase
MIPLELQGILKERLANRLKDNSPAIKVQSVGGGSINHTYKLSLERECFFCKLNSAFKFPHLFQSEKNGLELIQKQDIIKTPAVIDHLELEGLQILLLQWIDQGERTVSFWKKFGEQLARLHQVSDDLFGLYEDNYMGSLIQINTKSTKWTDFFIAHRLQPLVDQSIQLKLLTHNHQLQFERLYLRLTSIFSLEEKPSLLHGDLWSGNFLCDEHSEPVLIDPAVYFGHRSVDMGMTTLFGGFGSSFYEAYNYHYPFPPNYEEQWQICNLYPLLIHLILFGNSYLPQIVRILERFA